MLGSIRNRLVFSAIALIWLVGGLLAFIGHRQMTEAVRQEAVARVEEAVRVGQRLIETEAGSMDSPGSFLPRAKVMTIAAQDFPPSKPLSILLEEARTKGKSKGFILLEEGLSMVFIQQSPAAEEYKISVYTLRGANWLTDEVRNVVFGSSEKGNPPATVTIFEKEIRIATNVVLPDGRRAIGTRVSDEVAKWVLLQGQTWHDRAFVVDRWMITCYKPIRSPDEEVIGMLYAGLDEAPYVKEGKRNTIIFLVWILGFTLVISITAGYIGIRLARPLESLRDAAAALERGDKQKMSVSASDPDEIKALSNTFNRMADRVTAHAAELEASRNKAQKALDDYLEVLAFVAHELKSPISSALSQIYFVESGYAGEIPDKLSRPLEAIHRHLAYGNEMAQSFNNLSRAEGESFTPSKRLIPDFCEQVIQPAIVDFTTEISRRQMSIEFERIQTSACADPDLIRVVMDNLIGNAVKYGREGTQIRVSTRKTSKSLRVEVTNQGVGVPRERFPQLFSKFFRVKDPKLESRKGTGVGLYLVKKIIELHGGQVGVDGEYERWIKFYFEIPNEGLSI